MKPKHRGVVFPDYKLFIVTTFLFVLKPALGLIGAAAIAILKYIKKM